MYFHHDGVRELPKKFAIFAVFLFSILFLEKNVYLFLSIYMKI